MNQKAASLSEMVAALTREPMTEDQDWVRVGRIVSALFPQPITLTTPLDHARFAALTRQLLGLSRYARGIGRDRLDLDALSMAAMDGLRLAAFETQLLERERGGSLRNPGPEPRTSKSEVPRSDPLRSDPLRSDPPLPDDLRDAKVKANGPAPGYAFGHHVE
jgi:hypothetical protein